MQHRVTRYVAFLRGINLGKRRLEMSRLRILFEQLGFNDVETFIASGNVLFSTRERNARKLETRIATHLAQALGYDVDTFVRTLEHVEAIAKSTPFPEAPESCTVTVAFMHDELDARAAALLGGIETETDAFIVKSTEYFWMCRTRTSESRIWVLPEMKALKLPSATMRNMTSIRKLAARHGRGAAKQVGE